MRYVGIFVQQIIWSLSTLYVNRFLCSHDTTRGDSDTLWKVLFAVLRRWYSYCSSSSYSKTQVIIRGCQYIKAASSNTRLTILKQPPKQPKHAASCAFSPPPCPRRSRAELPSCTSTSRPVCHRLYDGGILCVVYGIYALWWRYMVLVYGTCYMVYGLYAIWWRTATCVEQLLNAEVLDGFTTMAIATSLTGLIFTSIFT